MVNEKEFAKCMRTDHKWENSGWHKCPVGTYPFPKEEVIIKAFKCKRCGAKDVHVFDKTEAEYKEIMG